MSPSTESETMCLGVKLIKMLPPPNICSALPPFKKFLLWRNKVQDECLYFVHVLSLFSVDSCETLPPAGVVRVDETSNICVDTVPSGLDGLAGTRADYSSPPGGW